MKIPIVLEDYFYIFCIIGFLGIILCSVPLDAFIERSFSIPTLGFIASLATWFLIAGLEGLRSKQAKSLLGETRSKVEKMIVCSVGYLLQAQWLTVLGDYSYEIYLVHWPYHYYSSKEQYCYTS